MRSKYFAVTPEPERAYIRFPGWLHAAIKKKAKVAGRSKNAVIMELLILGLKAEEAQTVVSEK